MAELVAPGGTLELLLAPAERDGLDVVPTFADEIIAGASCAFQPLGFELAGARTPAEAEILATGSTWARRLGAARSNGALPERAATMIQLVRR